MIIQQALHLVDYVGSTRLFRDVGDREAQAHVGEALRDAAKRVAMAGRVVKMLGDGMLCVYPDIGEALQVAESLRETPELASKFKQALHFGNTVVADGDVFGDSVNVLFRLLDFSSPGEIVVCGDLLQSSVGGSLRSRSNILGAARLLGRDGVSRIYGVTR